MSELKPCPFCKSLNVNDTTPPTADDGYYYRWVCPDCSACGPAALSVEEASKYWNTREPAVPVSELLGLIKDEAKRHPHGYGLIIYTEDAQALIAKHDNKENE